MMQAFFFVMMDWQALKLTRDADPSLDMDTLLEMNMHASDALLGGENTNLGGAPLEFLPQMLLEENPVRLSASSVSTTATREHEAFLERRQVAPVACCLCTEHSPMRCSVSCHCARL